MAHLGEYEHKVNKKTGGADSIFIFFELEVERIEEKWPEMKKRERRWVSFKFCRSSLLFYVRESVCVCGSKMQVC